MQEFSVEDFDVDYGPSPDPKGWQQGGPGDQDWEMNNSQLTQEWLRFLERMTENVVEQCRKHNVARAPIGWRDKQIRQFRRHVAARYGGQVYPSPAWIDTYTKRLRDRHGEEAVALFFEKWKQVH